MPLIKAKKKKFSVIPIGIALFFIIGCLLGYNFYYGNKSFFLVGETSSGHYQIELECQTCHQSPFAGKDEMQQACESCHGEELEKINDSHPRSAFNDPRNASLLNKLDARFCVSCHREHKPEITDKTGVTLAKDFCFHCHQKIAEERPSHQDFKYDSCASSGCHNFHDNTMLYESFIYKHLDEPATLKRQLVPPRTGLKNWIKKHHKETPLTAATPDIHQFSGGSETVSSTKIEQVSLFWSKSIHAQVEVNCTSCHQERDNAGEPLLSIKSVETMCGDCHAKSQQSFLEGKHGMRTAKGLSAMSTDKARSDVNHRNIKGLTCSSCHEPHQQGLHEASLISCMGCHQDQHTQNFGNSKHFLLWQQEMRGEIENGSGVTCATCHLPRIKKGKNVTVIHNQNLNLRPNTKMLRQVCMNCHGMEYSISALADRALVLSNFSHAPTASHPTIDLIKQRILNNTPSTPEEGESNEEP